jgi:[ribosomal protein S5]-alanine N-acetyltransferase
VTSGRTEVLSTGRLRLTTWLPSDYADLRALHSDPLVMRHMRSGAETAADTRARLDRFLREQAELGWTKWRLEDADRRLVGRAGFSLGGSELADRPRRELGYVLAPGLWGLGLATEVAGALVGWHRAHPDPQLRAELCAYAFAENGASRRVLGKVGFTLVAEEWRAGVRQARYELA